MLAMQELDESLHHVAMNMESCSGRGSELFAKRKKRSDKWVVDESNLGASPVPPSAHADKFVQQQMMAQVRFSLLYKNEIRGIGVATFSFGSGNPTFFLGGGDQREGV